MIDLLMSAALWSRVVQASTSVLWVALGGYLCFRSGVFNIGMEGTMLIGAFAAAVGSIAFGATGGLAFAAFIGALIGWLFAYAFVRRRADPLIFGLALNLAAIGGTALALQALFSTRGILQHSGLRSMPHISLPLIDQIPWVGRVFSGQSILTYIGWIAFAAVVAAMGRTRAGLTLRVVGESPEIAASAGRSPRRTRTAALVTGSAMMALGGAQLALGAIPTFQENMSAGRGWIALALLVVAGRNPRAILPLVLVFAGFDAVGISLQSVGIPTEIADLTPYITILGILVVAQAIKARNGESSLSKLDGSREDQPDSASA